MLIKDTNLAKQVGVPYVQLRFTSLTLKIPAKHCLADQLGCKHSLLLYATELMLKL